MAYLSNMMNNPQNPNWRGTSPFLGSAPRQSSRIPGKYRPVTPAPSPAPSPAPAPVPSPAPAPPGLGALPPWEFNPQPGQTPRMPRPGTIGSPTPSQPRVSPWKEWFYNTPDMVARRQPGVVQTTQIKPWQGTNGNWYMRDQWERANPDAAREYYLSNPRSTPLSPRLRKELNRYGPGVIVPNTPQGMPMPGDGLSNRLAQRQALGRIAGSTVSLPRTM